jgi:spectinomycin phosphotransferase
VRARQPMLEPPALYPERIIAALRRFYGLQVHTLTFLPVGLDVQAWAYQVATADAAAYFLKLRHGAVNEASLRVPRFLADHGVQQVVAPIPTQTQQLWGVVDGFTVVLYPFIHGVTGRQLGLQQQHWRSFGAALRTIHDTSIGPDLARFLTREPCPSTAHATWPGMSRWTEVMQALDAQAASALSSSPLAYDLAEFWRAKRGAVAALAARFEALGERLRAVPPSRVLCHADIHLNNLLIDREDRLWLVDWDETLQAPKECDLMFGLGGLGGDPIGPREEAWFLEGYGSTTVDRVALAYYRCLRALGDIGYCGEQLILMPEMTEVVKRKALQNLRLLFEPGSIVSRASQPISLDV